LGVTTDRLLGGGQRDNDTFPATVFCTGVRGFALRASRLSPREVAGWANGMFQTLTNSALRFDGLPIKYVGDGFLGFFSGPCHAERALRFGLEAHRLLGDTGLTLMLHGGEIYLGAIGHTDYARPDIIGETVNTAFLAMAWVAGHVPVGLGVSKTVMDGLASPPSWPVLTQVRIPGVVTPMDIFHPGTLPGKNP
jgi:class 3 adenylate cyclase